MMQSKADIIRQGLRDLVVLDIMIPGKSGAEAGRGGLGSAVLRAVASAASILLSAF